MAGNRKDPDHHLPSGSEKTGQHTPERTRTLQALDRVLENTVLIESAPNKKIKEKPDVVNIHRFYVPVKAHGHMAVLRVVAFEKNSGSASIEGIEIYDIIKERRPGLATPFKRGAKALSQGDKISIRDLLTGVKDFYGAMYFHKARNEDKAMVQFFSKPPMRR